MPFGRSANSFKFSSHSVSVHIQENFSLRKKQNNDSRALKISNKIDVK